MWEPTFSIPIWHQMKNTSFFFPLMQHSKLVGKPRTVKPPHFKGCSHRLKHKCWNTKALWFLVYLLILNAVLEKKTTSNIYHQVLNKEKMGTGNWFNAVLHLCYSNFLLQLSPSWCPPDVFNHNFNHHQNRTGNIHGSSRG